MPTPGFFNTPRSLPCRLERLMLEQLIGEEISCGSLLFNLYYLDTVARKTDMVGRKTVMNQLSEHQEEIQNLQDQFVDLLKSLSETIDARDPYSRGHSRRVARYGLAIGSKLGFSPHRLERMEIAALLHDIGKLGVEAFILAKPASLDELEMTAIRYHPLMGERILKPVKQLSDLLPFIRHHHERYDGQGYPDGLRGEGIPLESRVLAVADAFEAMISNRPYRKAKAPRAALEELREGAGTQFDPQVVEAFQRAFERGAIGVERDV
jgi:HD-GYP domain-containing protein (c-di-GMP phosphodiesterase class II)